jgi:hypothetical protein
MLSFHQKSGHILCYLRNQVRYKMISKMNESSVKVPISSPIDRSSTIMALDESDQTCTWSIEAVRA